MRGCDDDVVALVVVVLIGVAALTGVAVLLAMSESPLSVEPVDRIDDGLSDRPMTSYDVGGLRFRLGLRGYRMDDVDLALEKLRDALRDAEGRAEAAEQAVAVATLTKPTRSRRVAKTADTDAPGTLAQPTRASRPVKKAPAKKSAPRPEAS